MGNPEALIGQRQRQAHNQHSVFNGWEARNKENGID
jgi:hypothetical protein